MKRPNLFLVLIFSFYFTFVSYKIYKKLPCYFNKVKVGPSAQKDSGVRGGRCCVGCSAYKEKRGTSMEVKRGTPVVAIADMKVIKIEDSSAVQRSTSYVKEKYGAVAGKDHFTGGKELIKPFDALRIYFWILMEILFYIITYTKLLWFQVLRKASVKFHFNMKWVVKCMKPEDCGGYSEDLIKNNLNVPKKKDKLLVHLDMHTIHIFHWGLLFQQMKELEIIF